jgi:hypothetical protein
MPKKTIKRIGSYATSEDTLKVPMTVLGKEARKPSRLSGQTRHKATGPYF